MENACIWEIACFVFVLQYQWPWVALKAFKRCVFIMRAHLRHFKNYRNKIEIDILLHRFDKHEQYYNVKPSLCAHSKKEKPMKTKMICSIPIK